MNLLFLGYDAKATSLIDYLCREGWTVTHSADPVSDLSAFEAVVSFGYRYILKPAVIETARRPIINLHISYLPWNRGAHPLFWAALEGTPIGVTIHEIDAGIDTGPICFQKKVPIDPEKETFSSGYNILIREMEELFIEKSSSLLAGGYVAEPQRGHGSLHRMRDLPSGFSWSDGIAATVAMMRGAEGRSKSCR